MNSSNEPSANLQTSQRLRRYVMLLLLVAVTSLVVYSQYRKSRLRAVNSPETASGNAETEPAAVEIVDGPSAYHSNTDKLTDPYGKDSEWAVETDVATTSAGGDQTEVYLDARGLRKASKADTVNSRQD